MNFANGGDILQSDRTVARRWLVLAASSLVLAGSLALALVVARTPAIGALLGDPLVFKRALVVHVVLSLIIWFYAFVAGLFTLVPSRAPRAPLGRAAPWLGALAVALLVVAAGVPRAQPVLSNYIPVIDHPLFIAGLVLFAVALALCLLDPRLLPGNETPAGPVTLPDAARVGLRASALAVIAALATFFATWLALPRSLASADYYELLFWGGGHVLQFASVAAMVAVWMALLTPVQGASPLSRPQAVVVFGLLVLPALAGPVLALQDPLLAPYRLDFMRLMQWGIFPQVGLAFGACVWGFLRAAKAKRLFDGWRRDPRVWAFLTSASLTLLGFVLGALIRGSNTMVPAHYHAAIGAVTAAFMGMTWTLMAPLGMPVQSARLRRWTRVQPVLFGVGQAVFALGFGLAGAHGADRKAYAAEQVTRVPMEVFGLCVMGAGGLIAVAGGLLFLFAFFASWRRSWGAEAAAHLPRGRAPWTQTHP